MMATMAHERSERPWESYTVLDDQPCHEVKRIVVDPGRRLSYQGHALRSEHWFIVAGHGRVTLDGRVQALGQGDAIHVPAGTAHRMENAKEEPLVFTEVQHGSYFGEDDVVRLEDDYGGAGDRGGSDAG